MARKLRVQYPGATYHVTTWGGRRGAGCCREQLRESGEARAEEPIQVELRRKCSREAELGNPREGDGLKVRLAKRLRAETTVTMEWVAEWLCPGSRGHVTHLPYRERCGGSAKAPSKC